MRKPTILIILLVTGGILAASNPSQSQTEYKAKKYENPQWKTVVMVDYHPGKFGRAKEIIENYYMKASQKAGNPGPLLQVQMVTGEWDLMLVWELKGGISDMDWDISPDNVKWRAAMNELTGSDEKTRELQKEYSALINRSTSYIVKNM